MGRLTMKTSGLALGLLAILGGATGCPASTSNNDAGPSTPADAGHPDAGTTPDAGSHSTDGGPMYTPQNNHTWATAETLTTNSETVYGVLADATMTKDYYKFSAAAGDTYAAFAISQGTVANNTSGDLTSVVDTVVTIYDSNMNQIAQDDNAWPSFGTDSQLFFEVPATGDYYLVVCACSAAFSTGCGTASDVTYFNYYTFVANVDLLRESAPEIYGGKTQNGTIADAVTVPYQLDTAAGATGYDQDIIDGNLQSATDTQVFAFTPPTASPVPTGTEAHVDFYVQTPGANDGDGSTASPIVWVTDSTGTNVLARLDVSNYGNGDSMTDGPADLALPVTLGSQYYLFVQNTVTTSNPTTDYFFILHEVDSSNPLEQTSAHGTPATAQVLTAASGETGDYFVSGTIADPGSEEDWYEVDAPSSSTTVTVSCAAERFGSGLRGTTMGLYTVSGGTPTLITGTGATEAANMEFTQTNVAIPSGTTKAYLEVTAASQDPAVTGNYYECGVTYQ
jgi:hypothetical protein